MTTDASKQTPAEIIAACMRRSESPIIAVVANDIVSALAAAGYKILPREPTEAMLKAAYEDLLDRTPRIGHYRAMWDAAS